MSDKIDPSWSTGDEGERTVIRPRPGGRRPAPVEPPPGPQAPSQTPRDPAFAVAIGQTKGLNPLVSAATPLLTMLVSLRNTRAFGDVLGLRTRVERQIRAFETDASAHGVDPETVHTARYCLCTAVDEAVLNTPWGADSVWREESLLSMFHRERWGGEKFFLILDRMMKDPGRSLPMLELLYLCLALGFQGKYHVLTGGQRTLDNIVEGVYETIRRQRGDFERDLSPHWEGEPDARTPLSHPVPIWVIATLATALLLSTYVGFSYFINDSSMPVFEELAALGKKEAPPDRAITLKAEPVKEGTPAEIPAEEVTVISPIQPPEEDLVAKLSGFLAPEIRQKLVEVSGNDTAITVRIVGSGIFASAKDQVSAEYRPRIERIATALAEHNSRLGGGIKVIGHTDNVPIKRTLRFQNNLELSLARAKSVAAILRRNKAITRPITEEGQADTNPLVPNNTAENRARNRRVEILVEK